MRHVPALLLMLVTAFVALLLYSPLMVPIASSFFVTPARPSGLVDPDAVGLRRPFAATKTSSPRCAPP